MSEDDEEGKSVFSTLRGYFLTGLLVTAPLAITIWVTLWFLEFVDNNVANLIPPRYNPDYYLPFEIPGLGLVMAILFFITIGWFARNYFGKLTIRISEYFLEKMPIVRTIYSALKQIFETVMASQSQAFRDVVMFEYPRKGIWVMGFVTGTTKGEVQSLTDNEVVNVFLPTTPNPTSGFLLFVPRKDLIFMKMSVEEAIKMVVSGGIITPPEKDSKKAD